MTETYGLLIERQSRHGSEQVHAKLMARREGQDHPINVIDAPLAELGMYGHAYAYDGQAKLIGWEPEYRDVFAIDQVRAAGMAKMLKRLAAAFAKDGVSEDPSDGLMSMAKLFKLTFIVERAGPARSAFQESQWTWRDIPAGRDRYRVLVEEAKAVELTKPENAKRAAA